MNLFFMKTTNVSVSVSDGLTFSSTFFSQQWSYLSACNQTSCRWKLFRNISEMEVRVITSIYHHHTIKSPKKTPNRRSVNQDSKLTKSPEGSFIIDITAVSVVSVVHEQTYSAKTIQSAQKQHSAGFRAHSFPDSVSDPAAGLLGAAIFLWLIFTGQGCMAPLYPPPDPLLRLIPFQDIQSVLWFFMVFEVLHRLCGNPEGTWIEEKFFSPKKRCVKLRKMRRSTWKEKDGQKRVVPTNQLHKLALNSFLQLRLRNTFIFKRESGILFPCGQNKPSHKSSCILLSVTSVITGRNKVMAKVMFLLVSVILLTWGVSASVHAGIPHTTPPEQTPPREQTPPEQTPPGADTPRSRHPQSRHPPGADTPPREADSGIRSMSGRYTSYWNAILLTIFFKPRLLRPVETLYDLLMTCLRRNLRTVRDGASNQP